MCILYAPIFVIKMVILIIGAIAYFEWMDFNPIREKAFYFIMSIVFSINVLFGLLPNYIFLIILFLAHMIISFNKIDKESVLAKYYLFGGILYISLYTFFVNIIELKDGRLLFLLLCVSVWVGDSFAYFCGKSFGKIRLAVRISPKKTYEGAICGVIFGCLAGIFFGYLSGVNLKLAFGIGIIANIVGIFGDLAESVIKRSYNKKDSSGIIPGHGGILDRLDSLAFSSFAVYIMLLWKIF